MKLTNRDGVYTVTADGYAVTVTEASFSPTLGGVAVCALDARQRGKTAAAVNAVTAASAAGDDNSGCCPTAARR